jgi:FlaA1/EpsC-like NDP-sugar epimerase
MGSRGSVIPFFIKQAKSGVLPITDMDMTRFNITLDEGVEMVTWALEHAIGGEILVPKIPSYTISTVAEAIGPGCKKEIVGIRPGEKLHEEMITLSDSPNTVDLGDYYAIINDKNRRNEFIEKFEAKLVHHGFEYQSGTNEKFLKVDDIRKLINIHIDSSFVPF